jgi:hypothetical protein
VASITREEWAAAFLDRLGIPKSDGAMQAVIGWATLEGGAGPQWGTNNLASYNPLNTTQVPSKGSYGNTGGQGNIKVYTSWEQGLDATVATINNGLYEPIKAALRKGNAAAAASAIASSKWGSTSNVIPAIAAAPKNAGTSVGPQGLPIQSGSSQAASNAVSGSAGGTVDPSTASGDVGKSSTALKLLLQVALIIAGAGLAVAGLSRMVGVRNPASLAAARGVKTAGAAAA